MLEKLKNLAALRKQAQEMKSTMSAEKVTVESFHGKIKLTMNGNQEVESLLIEPEILTAENKGKIENEIKAVFEKAIKEIQKAMARKIQSGELNLPF